jgi:hypothetical protein
MNVDRILRVADAIEKHEIKDLGFNMGSYYSMLEEDKSGYGCGTTACIGGWAMALAYPGNYLERPWSRDKSGAPVFTNEAAAEWLGLDDERATELMLQDGVIIDATAAEAVRTLRHLAATGEVNWNLPEATP